MEFKGTKGKWIIQDSIIKSESKEFLAFTAGLTGRVDDSRLEKESWLDMRARIKPELEKCETEKKANALLISKAPELLELLNLFLKEFEYDNATEYECGLFFKAKNLIKEATEL